MEQFLRKRDPQNCVPVTADEVCDQYITTLGFVGEKQRVANVYEKTVDVLYMLADSTTPEEIEKLSPKEKLLALARLQPILDARRRMKLGRSLFKGIVIAKRIGRS